MRSQPFVSANDGGSGIALLMELAHHMKDLDTNVGVDFVFFDGEEYVCGPGRRVFLRLEVFRRPITARTRGKNAVHRRPCCST